MNQPSKNKPGPGRPRFGTERLEGRGASLPPSTWKRLELIASARGISTNKALGIVVAAGLRVCRPS